MIDNAGKTKQILSSLLATQNLAVLSTHSDGQPYASLVAFAASEDLKHLLFVTERGSRKYANLHENPRVAMLIDNRSNRESDFIDASAATALGMARELSEIERTRWLKLYLARHPYLETFAESSACVLVQVQVDNYILVNSLREVTELRP
jgi:heme iron utilization protein